MCGHTRVAWMFPLGWLHQLKEGGYAQFLLIKYVPCENSALALNSLRSCVSSLMRPTVRRGKLYAIFIHPE